MTKSVLPFTDEHPEILIGVDHTLLNWTEGGEVTHWIKLEPKIVEIQVGTEVVELNELIHAWKDSKRVKRGKR